MKTFYASLIVFVLLLALISVNAVFIHRTAGDLETQLRELPSCEAAEHAVAQLEAYWNKRKAWIGFSVPATKMEEMSNHITELRNAAEQQDCKDFELARSLTLETLWRIRHHEKFTAENLF